MSDLLRCFACLSQLVLIAAWLCGCSGGSKTGTSDELLVDEAAAVGLEFVHRNGMSGHLYFSEMTGPGAALFDFDKDGDLDIFLLQGHPLGTARSAVDGTVAERSPWRDRLFRNDLQAGSGSDGLSFTDITDPSGLDSRGYGMGAATGDIDNDGWTDLYVTNFGGNQLWRNNGLQGGAGLSATEGVTFSKITEPSGTDDARWSSSATFLDFDRDGWLDLYVVNYTDFRITNHKLCRNPQGAADYCGPRSYQPETDRLFRNLGLQGDGVALGTVAFEDVSALAGMQDAPAPGLGVVTADFDADGWIDIYVANDQAHNQLWMNLGDGTFRDEALMRGCAVDAQGQPQASMGVDAGDIDGDGDIDLFMTHLTSETNTLYLNDGHGIFTERTAASGLASPSFAYTGFGAVLFDLENDGRLDLLAVNGEVRVLAEQRAAGEALPLRQPNQLYRNETTADGVRFADWSSRAPILSLALVSRGAAVGDFDNDGDADILVQNNNGPTQLLINRLGADNAWLGLRLLGVGGRHMLGARVGLLRRTAPTLWRRVRTDSSYLVANDPRVLFGLGAAAEAGPYRAQVHWPSGSVEIFEDLTPGRYQDLEEGMGRPAEGSL